MPCERPRALDSSNRCARSDPNSRDSRAMSKLVDRLRSEFTHLVTQSDPPLMACALALSRLLQRGDLWSGTLDKLEELQELTWSRCGRATAADRVDATCALMRLLVEDGFTGNRQDYENVANSFLDRVLQSRRGLPITLSVLTVHLARGADLDLAGVGFPGHFLVGVDLDTASPAVFDPFRDGRRVSGEDLAAMYREATGRPMTATAPMLRDLLRPCDARSILSRMLRNLQHHYSLRGAHDRMTEVVGLLAEIHPDMTQLRALEGRLTRKLLELH